MTSEQRVLDALSDGRWHTLSGIAWGLTETRRTVEEAVEELRLRGEPIVGGNDGIKLTRNTGEIREYVASRRRRTLTVALGTRRLLQTARRLESGEAGQRVLWESGA